MKKINPVFKYILSILSSFVTHIRDYGMYIALIVIFVVFTIMTDGLFLGPINFTNLLNQAAYVAVLAVGMTLVIVTRQIDLSVGYLGAFLGAFMVVSVENKGMSILLAFAFALVITMLVGLVKGSLVAKFKVPSFVVTLGAMFIFKGMLMIQTDNRTVPTSNQFFQNIGIGYLSESKIFGLNALTLIVGVVLVLSLVISTILRYRKHINLGVKVESVSILVTKTIFMIAILSFFIYTLAKFRGISYSLLITIIVVMLYHFLTTKTVIGRKVYAVGSNPEAAELSGINVKQIFMVVFISMGILGLIAGIMYVSRVQNTSPQHGVSWELYAIASCYIGGTSANGGVGKVINSAIGAVIITALTNGMALAGINANLEPIILGSVLVLSVIFDIYTRNVRPIDLVAVHYSKDKNKAELLKAKQELKEVRQALKKANKEENEASIITLEYELTRKLGNYNRIRDLIRSSTEEDYQDLLT